MEKNVEGNKLGCILNGVMWVEMAGKIEGGEFKVEKRKGKDVLKLAGCLK